MILLAIGAMHFLQIVTTVQAIPLLGGAYLVLIAATLAVAASLVTRGDSRSWAAVGIVSAGAVGGYIFTRLMNTPSTTRTSATGRACSASPRSL
ncbi:MAG TPA: hypothetical protein VLL25_05845 [Acidimicrobiales bacterium]|nr:hypothetical protein [Acidimicrobiales bacterium]